MSGRKERGRELMGFLACSPFPVWVLTASSWLLDKGKVFHAQKHLPSTFDQRQWENLLN